MKKLLLLLLIGVFSLPVFSQITYSGSIDNTDPTYNRTDEGVPPTNLSPIGTNVYYDVISFIVTTPGLITFTSNSPWDNFATLYSPAGFNPASPLTNALLANDDQSGSNFGFTYNFTVPGTYYLVITSFKNGISGSYSVTQSPVSTIALKLLSFTADKTFASGNIVKWSTADETNIEKYQVLHSIDGKNFVGLPGAYLNARNVNGNSDYNFTDKAPVAGLNFYRLEIKEKSGRTTVSQVAIVNNKKNGSAIVKLFPNPAVNYLYIETKTAQSGKALISIIGSGGETLYSKEYTSINRPVLSVDVRKLAPGKYFVKTIIDKQETIATFIKN